MADQKIEVVALNKQKTSKERLVSQFTQEVGGVASYWNKIPVEQLRALHDAIEGNETARAALSTLVQQLQEAKQTNTNLNRRNFGLMQTAAKYERIADYLTQLNAQLEQQKNELLKELQNLLDRLTTYESSEILQGIKQVRNFVGSLIR